MTFFTISFKIANATGSNGSGVGGTNTSSGALGTLGVRAALLAGQTMGAADPLSTLVAEASDVSVVDGAAKSEVRVCSSRLISLVMELSESEVVWNGGGLA